MTTDLKVLAEAATPGPRTGFVDKGRLVAIMPSGRPGDICTFADPPSDADAAFMLAATPAAILALYAERDGAMRLLKIEGEAHNLTLDERDKAQASLASYKEEVERLRGALETIANLHIPDQPAHFGGDELEWAQRHVGTLRRLAIEALTKETPYAE